MPADSAKPHWANSSLHAELSAWDTSFIKALIVKRVRYNHCQTPQPVHFQRRSSRIRILLPGTSAFSDMEGPCAGSL